MSVALQLSWVRGFQRSQSEDVATPPLPAARVDLRGVASGVPHSGIALWAADASENRANENTEARRNETNGPASEPDISLAFYRRHTERMLRRYLYASMQVGRAPSILSDPVGRGWVSSRPVRTFEDAVIFVLDVEKCLERLSPLDRAMLSRIVLQEYTQVEAAALLGMSPRAMSYKFPQALDRLTEQLLAHGVLVLPR